MQRNITLPNSLLFHRCVNRNLIFNLRLLLVLLPAALLFLSSFPAFADGTVSIPTSAMCLPAFPDRDGWYGGDGAYSIRLDAHRTLWLFGDTFASDKEGMRNRVDMDVIMGTTLAVSACSPDGKFDIHYFLKKKDGKFISSFGNGEWLWPQDPFIVEKAAPHSDRVSKTLYIPLLVVEAGPDVEGPLKFGIIGHRFARIEDFSGQNPNLWKVAYIDLTAVVPKEIQAVATTSVVHKPFVYFYPVLGMSGNMLARIPLEQIDQPIGAMEYFSKDGTWKKGLCPADARIVLDAGVSELSIRYHDSIKKWVAVYVSLENKGNRLLYREADRMEGPWTPPVPLIVTIPEVDPKNPEYDRNSICYAGKEHMEFSTGKSLVATYVCNSLEDFQNRLGFMRKNLFLYRPVVNVLPYPAERP